VVAAVGPEAKADPRGFDRAVRRALEPLAKVEEDSSLRCRRLSSFKCGREYSPLRNEVVCFRRLPVRLSHIA
jgi:hypothetical protein